MWLQLKRENMKVTIDEVMEFGPCYSLDKVTQLFCGRDELSTKDITNLAISKKDIIWILDEILYKHSPNRANKLARRIALDVVDLWDCPDITLWYLMTGDDASMAAAISAARAVACDSACDSDWDATMETAMSAAIEAARASVRTSVRAVAMAAARCASRCASWGSASVADFDAAWDSAREAALEKYINWIYEAM